MGVESGTRGAIYFDDFESRRFSLIGLLAGPGITDPEPAAEPGWLGRVAAYYENTFSGGFTPGYLEKDGTP